jgi:hypothetical protein
MSKEVEMNIPLIIGVTGHRNIRQEDHKTLKEKVRQQLLFLKQRCPETQLIMLNSLAQGADQLCAEIALELNIALIVPLPFSLDRYREDFSDEALLQLNRLCSLAKEVFVVQPLESPIEPTNDFNYRQAGLYIIRHCHILLACWDGKGGDLMGCGSASLVEMIKQGSYIAHGQLSSHNDSPIIHIVTQRQNEPPLENAFAINIIEPFTDALSELLTSTNDTNKDIRNNQGTTYPLVETPLEGISERLHNAYQQSDRCSNTYQRRYLKAMRQLSWCGVFLVISFLLYDEAESNIFLITYGLLILLSLTIYLKSKKDQVHIKYLEYRALAETLRVQFYLSMFGIGENITEHFTWTQKKSNTWIRKAVTSLLIGNSSKQVLSARELKSLWIDDQLSYHKKALIKHQQQDRLNQRMTKLLLFYSITLFILVLIIEFFFPTIATIIIPIDPLHRILLFHPEQDIIVRGVLKILLGTISAITLFLSNYYGKLSLNRKISDHLKMIDQYEKIQPLFNENLKNAEELLLALAKEEILENGSWLSYCKDNELTINL